MTSLSRVAERPQVLPVPSAPGPWIQSPSYDLAFLMLAPLVTLPLVLIELAGFGLVALAGFVLALVHYLSTFTFYLWDDNRAYHRARWMAFFGGPLLIAAAYLMLLALGAFGLVSLLIFAWNTYHVARQSCGIASIYRHKAGVTDAREKQLANAAIISANVWFALWNIETHESVMGLVSLASPALPRLAWWTAGTAALVALGRLGVGLARRARRGPAPSTQELAILLTGIGLFHPYLWLADSFGATYAMLLPHYLQYLGLVWLLHYRRLARPAASMGELALRHLARRPARLVAVMAMVGLLLYGAKWSLVSTGHAQAFEAFYLLVAFLHFYLDALFWAFRDPHVRRTLGPYLTPRS